MQTPDQVGSHASGAEMQPVPLASKIATLQQTIDELALQKGRLEAELRLLEAAPISLFGTGNPEHPRAVLPPREKIALFLELFGARRDVYPKFWENPSAGKKGYSPAYVTDYSVPGFQKRFLPLDERVVEAHLRGPHQAIGGYVSWFKMPGPRARECLGLFMANCGQSKKLR